MRLFRRATDDALDERLAQAENETARVHTRVDLIERRMDEIEEALELRRRLIQERVRGPAA